MKPFSHFRTITRHRHAVLQNCIRAGIPWRGLLHDLSKYTPTEFVEGARCYEDGRRSPNARAREEQGYSLAWMHHKGRNRHHFEYWTDYDPVSRQMKPVKMPAVFVGEMFCDRVAASRIYRGDAYRDGDPLAYYLKGVPTRVIHPETAEALEHFLRVLADGGEEAAFGELRAWIRRERREEKQAKKGAVSHV